MKKFLMAFVLLVLLTPAAPAESVQSIANRKAKIAATRLIRGHVGGGLGSARFEGVGWGTSPQLALRQCCYSGRRPVVAQAVYKGRDGYYYACRLFR
jgi:opacity protein-like surface antigen